MSEELRIGAETFLYYSAAWMGTYLIHSTVLLGLVALLVSSRRMNPAVESLYWKVAMAGSVASSTLATFSVEVLSPEIGPASLSLSGLVGRGASVLGGLALVLALIGLARLPLAWAPLRLALRQRHAARPETWRDFEAVRKNARYTGAVTLSESPYLTTPIAMGRDEICLPAHGFSALSATERQTVLAHELAHIVHRDQRWLLLSHVAERALFVQPLNRLARRRLRECAEFLADDFAVARIGNRKALAGALIRVAQLGEQASRSELPAFLRVSEGSLFLRRGQRLLTEESSQSSRPGPNVRCALALLVLAAGLALPRVVPPCNCHILTHAMDRNAVPTSATALVMKP